MIFNPLRQTLIEETFADGAAAPAGRSLTQDALIRFRRNKAAMLSLVFVVALIVLGNFEMFASLLGTWIPFSLIFASTYVTGTFIRRDKQAVSVA